MRRTHILNDRLDVGHLDLVDLSLTTSTVCKELRSLDCELWTVDNSIHIDSRPAHISLAQALSREMTCFRLVSGTVNVGYASDMHELQA
jgi:hypothetical protein